MIRVIGLGSPFGMDQIGWMVIRQLKGQVPRGVDLVELDRPGAGLVSWFQGVTDLMIVDAATDLPMDRPFVEIEAARLGDHGRLRTSGHGLELAQSIALAESLDLAPRRLTIYVIPVEQHACTGLDACDPASAMPLVQHLSTLLRELGPAARAPAR